MPITNTDDVLVWWLSEGACKDLHPILDAMPLPGYIKSEFYNRLGRPGRGRLWVPPHISVDEIEWDDTQLTAILAAKCGGIVFERKDLNKIIGWPGFVTNWKLNLVQGI